MFIKINTQEDLDTVVTLEEVKAQSRVTFDLDDVELTSMKIGCTELAQKYLHKLLTPSHVSIELEDYEQTVILPFGNVTKIDRVFVDDVETTDYTFSDISQKLKIGDETYRYGFSNLKVDFDCGYANGTVPTSIKRGILVMVSTMYNLREDVQLGMSVTEIPLSATRILHAEKYHVV